MGVEFIDLGGNRLADGGALLLGGRGVVAACIHVLLHLHRVDGIEQAERLEDGAEFLDRLVGAGDDLLGHGGALLLVAVQQAGSRLALQHEGKLPCKVEGILDRGVGAKPVRWRMAMRGVAHAEDTAALHRRRIHVVDRPGGDRLDLDRQVRFADQIAHHLGGESRIDLGRRLVDVIAPDDQPFVPRPHHAHQPHADAADIRARLHHPIEYGRTMGDISGQVGLEQDVHRSPDPHPSLEAQAGILGDLGVAAVGADQIFRADRQLPARQPVAAGGGDPVLILAVAQIFGRHARLRAARTGGLEQERLHEGLWQVVHVRRRRELVLGAAERMHAPAFHAADLLSGQRGAEDVFAHQFLVGGEEIGFVLHIAAEIAQHLHGALVGDMGARRIGQPAIAVDRHVLDAVAGQQRCAGRTGRAGSDDENVSFDVSHAALP